MKLENAAITLLFGHEGMTIELHDNKASITFAHIILNPAPFGGLNEREP
jgi:hypothetical protein